MRLTQAHKRQARNDPRRKSISFQPVEIYRSTGRFKQAVNTAPLPRLRFNFPRAKVVYDLWHIFPRHRVRPPRRDTSRCGIVPTMELTEQRSLRHEYETVRGKRERLSCSEIKILLAHAESRCYDDPLPEQRASRIDLSIIESRHSRFPLAFSSLVPARA